MDPSGLSASQGSASLGRKESLAPSCKRPMLPPHPGVAWWGEEEPVRETGGMPVFAVGSRPCWAGWDKELGSICTTWRRLSRRAPRLQMSRNNQGGRPGGGRGAGGEAREREQHVKRHRGRTEHSAQESPQSELECEEFGVCLSICRSLSEAAKVQARSRETGPHIWVDW